MYHNRNKNNKRLQKLNNVKKLALLQQSNVNEMIDSLHESSITSTIPIGIITICLYYYFKSGFLFYILSNIFFKYLFIFYI